MCAHTRGRGRGLMTASALKGTWTNTGRAGGQPTSTLVLPVVNKVLGPHRRKRGRTLLVLGRKIKKSPHQSSFFCFNKNIKEEIKWY
jgi:hypothetical protein